MLFEDPLSVKQLNHFQKECLLKLILNVTYSAVYFVEIYTPYKILNLKKIYTVHTVVMTLYYK